MKGFRTKPLRAGRGGRGQCCIIKWTMKCYTLLHRLAHILQISYTEYMDGHKMFFIYLFTFWYVCFGYRLFDEINVELLAIYLCKHYCCSCSTAFSISLMTGYKNFIKTNFIYSSKFL